MKNEPIDIATILGQRFEHTLNMSRLRVRMATIDFQRDMAALPRKHIERNISNFSNNPHVKVHAHYSDVNKAG